MKILHEEPRHKLHIAILKNLHILAKKVSHLWTIDNINSLIKYTRDQSNNEARLLHSSEILCTLSQNSNVYFYFVFNSDLKKVQEQLEKKQQEHELNLSLVDKVDNISLRNLIETMIFHSNKTIAFNFCLFSTTLLVFQLKNLKTTQNEEKVFGTDTNTNCLDHLVLFELTKNGLFSIILECYKSLKSQNNDESFKHLKVFQIYIYYMLFHST